MFKPSQPMMARLRLTTKQVNGGYYKGNRTDSMGRFTKHAKYVIDWKKVRTYVVPENLDEFKLTPFVTKVMEPTKSQYVSRVFKNGSWITHATSLKGKDYLNLWVQHNEEEFKAKQKEERETEEKGGQRKMKEQERLQGLYDPFQEQRSRIR